MVYCDIMVLTMLKQETQVHSLVNFLAARIAQSLLAKVNTGSLWVMNFCHKTQLIFRNLIFRNLKAYSTQTETKVRHLNDT